MATSAITEAMPITIPSIVRPERVLLAVTADSVSSKRSDVSINNLIIDHDCPKLSKI
jgi:hypothetical protein